MQSRNVNTDCSEYRSSSVRETEAETSRNSGSLSGKISVRIRRLAPKVHCLTNPVTMNDAANVLLAAGGSAIMAQAEEEAAEITAICQATLLNTGVPDEHKIRACILAGKKANELGQPVVLDPVGAGASEFRKNLLTDLLSEVSPTVIRCNQGEAAALLSLAAADKLKSSGTEISRMFPADYGDLCRGVESGLKISGKAETELAGKLAEAFSCTVLITGTADVVSDGKQSAVLEGGDTRIRRITGGGCMLSALCALACCAADEYGGEAVSDSKKEDTGYGGCSEVRKLRSVSVFDTVCWAGRLWKRTAEEAGHCTDRKGGGIGSFHMALFDALESILL